MIGSSLKDDAAFGRFLFLFLSFYSRIVPLFGGFLQVVVITHVVSMLFFKQL